MKTPVSSSTAGPSPRTIFLTTQWRPCRVAGCIFAVKPYSHVYTRCTAEAHRLRLMLCRVSFSPLVWDEVCGPQDSRCCDRASAALLGVCHMTWALPTILILPGIIFIRCWLFSEIRGAAAS